MKWVNFMRTSVFQLLRHEFRILCHRVISEKNWWDLAVRILPVVFCQNGSKCQTNQQWQKQQWNWSEMLLPNKSDLQSNELSQHNFRSHLLLDYNICSLLLSELLITTNHSNRFVNLKSTRLQIKIKLLLSTSLPSLEALTLLKL